MLIMRVPTPSDQQKEPCPRPHHHRSAPFLDELAAAADARRLSGTGLLAALARVLIRANDGVCGIRSPTILALAVCAVLAGFRSFTAISEWAANASGQILAVLEVDEYPPCESTIRRTLQRLDGDVCHAQSDRATGQCVAHVMFPLGISDQ